MAPRGDLHLLKDRLNAIQIPHSTTAVLDSNSPEIKIEEGVIDSTLNKFICGECGQSFHRITYLVHHYTRLHTQTGFVCSIADCGKPCITQSVLTRHCNTKHSRPVVCQYPGCTKQFRSWPRFNKHLDSHSDEAHERGYYRCLYGRYEKRFADLTRITQHAYQAHPGVSAASGCLECHERFPTDQELSWHYRTQHPFPDPVNLNCPASGCSQSFSNTDDLYLHYRNSRHPPYIPNQVPRHLAFKCPFGFCARAYSSEIGLGIHCALAHGSELGGLTVATIPLAFNIPESSTDQQPASGHQADSPIERIYRDDVESVI